VTRPSVILPEPLKPGDTIGVISPAGVSDAAAMADGVALLQSWGYRVKVFPHALNQWGYLAGTDAERLADLVAAFTDPEITAVLAARGGFGCTRLLPHIPWQHLQPKLLIGFSDLTALLLPLYDRLGWLGLHGPMLTSNLIEFDPFTADQLQRMWAGGFAEHPVKVVSQQPVQWLHGTQMSGPLTGGNLSLLAALCGTPWQPQTNGHILFIEDWKEAYYSIDRQYQQLRQAGLLDNLAGLLLGDFSDIRTDADWSLAAHWQQLTADLGIPVAFGLTAGHGDLNTTLAIGGFVSI
jgi:muramoyltetrapeptide carboxypeptidase